MPSNNDGIGNQMLKRAIVIFSLFAPSVVATLSIAGAAEAEGSKNGTYFLIGPNAMSVPVGYFVMIRKGTEFGAFRFLSVSETSGSGAIGTSRYESFRIVRQLSNGNWNVEAARTASIVIEELRGSHAFAWQPGSNKLRVGRWYFGCYGPHLVNMSKGFAEKDEGYEFAPTAFNDVSSLDPTSNLLHWYRFNEKSVARVAVASLPGSDEGAKAPR